MSLKEQLERIIALEQARESSHHTRPDQAGGEDGQGLFAPLMSALRELRASLDRRPKA